MPSHLKFLIALFGFIFFCFQTSKGQDYVDLFKINYAAIPSSSFENFDVDNDVFLINVSATAPIVINDKLAIITGADYIQNRLELFPNSGRINLNNINLKLGLNIKHTDKLSGTYVFLPRISSQGLHTEGNHLFFGGAAVLNYQLSENFQWRFGAYASSEGFGAIATPIIGFYYKKDKLEITANLPVNGDLNYTIGKDISIGGEFQTPVKTYSLRPQAGFDGTYVEVGNIEFGPYFEYRLLNKSILLRAQIGYNALSYELFSEGDELPFRFIAFEFGDDRTLLNADFNGNIFYKIGLTYRFHIEEE